jgi:branched-chain amino acid transport system permease protein
MESPAIRNSAILLVVAFASLPPLFLALGEPFYLDVVSRIMIFAISAISLDLILGFGGLISFGHAVYLGIGGYAVGILSYYGVSNGFLHFGAAIFCSALAALCIGAVSLRTSGVFFIMITLAFSQMVYFLAISIATFGGDDGLTLRRPSDLGLNFREPAVFYYFVLAALASVLWISGRIVNSRFGMLIRAIKFNETRMVAVGFPTFRYKLTMFVIAGGICGFAGALLANQTLFVSPSIMHWSRSGELLIMVIAGGIGTLVGPVLGAALYLLLEKILSSWTVYWSAAIGIGLVSLVLLGKRRGLLGLVIRARQGPKNG